jgi:internalin A
LDLSKNKLQVLNPKIVQLKLLKSLKVDDNQLYSGTLVSISTLTNLKSLSANNNQLGRQQRPPPTTTTSSPHSETSSTSPPPLPNVLPKGLKTLLLSNNFLFNVPQPIVSPTMTMLEKLDLSRNHLVTIPEDIVYLTALSDLNLDGNSIVSLPSVMGQLTKLKTLSLKQNQISGPSQNNKNKNNHHTVVWTEKNPQPLPESLFRDTPLIDLNLHGNPITSTQLNAMEGYDDFLARRRSVKFTGIMTGAMTDLDTCGLD